MDMEPLNIKITKEPRKNRGRIKHRLRVMIGDRLYLDIDLEQALVLNGDKEYEMIFNVPKPCIIKL